MNKKGQLDVPVITFAVVLIGLIILAPVVLKLWNSIHTPLSSALGNTTGQGGVIAQQNVDKIFNTASNMWDKVVMIAVIFSLMLMLISSFLINTHPFWVVVYIIVTFLLVLFAPNIIQVADNIYENANFNTEVNQLSIMDFMRNNYPYVLVGTIVLSGIIMYGKVVGFLKPSRGRR